MNENTARAINILGKFCGKRDIGELRKEDLLSSYGISQADVMVLFGGSIIAGGDLLAMAMADGIAQKYVIVGGAGHTTETLRQKVHMEYPEIETTGLPEAEVFQKYLHYVHGCKADMLETKSTNCGNNITYLLDLLHDGNINFKNIILMQDATMQNRMDAGIRKYVSADVQIINYAAYSATVQAIDGKLQFCEKIHGMWNMDRYIDLLMGEIPRLTDDKNGYGPQGKNYIAHVDIPQNVQDAFKQLKAVFGTETRKADPAFASKQ